jgi:IclR family acetate operon transcriptional repressor
MLLRNQPAGLRRRRRPKGSADQDGTPRTAGEQYHLKAIARALDVLECFTVEAPNLSLKDIAQTVRLPESSLFRILLTLEAKGYLVRNADGAYCLPAKLLLGKVHERAEHLRGILHPYLEELGRRFNETASLAYLYGDRIQVLDTVESFHEIRMTNKPGRVLPPHCSSLGKAIAAFQEPVLMDCILENYGLFRRTEHTIIDRQALLSGFAGIRARGYAVDREESVPGGICIGAPIVSAGGRVVSALSVSTPCVRMAPGREQQIIEAVLEVAYAATAAIHP